LARWIKHNASSNVIKQDGIKHNASSNVIKQDEIKHYASSNVLKQDRISALIMFHIFSPHLDFYYKLLNSKGLHLNVRTVYFLRHAKHVNRPIRDKEFLSVHCCLH
jgi:hypothetical protein